MNIILRLMILSLINLTLLGCAGVRLPVSPPDQPPPPPVMKIKPRVALVLGAGGARGYAHLGVLQALEEAGIKVDLIAGSSAGSVIAALYADNQSAIKTTHIMMRASFWDFAEISNVGFFGMLKGSNLEYFMLKHMHSRDFLHLQTRLLVATTDMATGNTYVVQSGPIAPAVLASSALPGVVTPVKLYGHLLIDGGVADPVPVNLVKPFHPKVIIAVNLSRMQTREMPTTAIGVYNAAYDIMWRKLTAESLRYADVVINPDVGDSTFDTDHRREMYQAGLKEGRLAIPKIRKLLNS